jgi:putative membrane protein
MEVEKKDRDVLSEEISRIPGAREHLANERTLLAWIRTSIGIMAFGFVVVKFSLFIKQISILLGKTTDLPPQHGYSSMIGIFLVGVGTLIILLSYFNFKRAQKQLNNKSFQSSYSSYLILSLIMVLLIVSIFLILYLMQSIGQH